MPFTKTQTNECFFSPKGEEALVVPNIREADLILVSKIRDGSLDAFNQLVEKYKRRLFSIIYNLTANREDAFDLVQETLIKSFRSIHQFNAKASFYTWICRIAVNTTLSFLKKRRGKYFLQLEQLDGSIHQDADYFLSEKTSEKDAYLKELQEKLNNALQKLSAKHRAVVVLFEIEGLSHQEIAKILDCSEGTVRSRLHYAKNQLQTLLKDYIANP
jgi:RNA polymerase sigma-70 factor, ECF subfamily